MAEPILRFDINGDALDLQHCGINLDVYTNSLITGFQVNEDGTYVLVGEPGFDVPDNLPDHFFDFLDAGGAFRHHKTRHAPDDEVGQYF